MSETRYAIVHPKSADWGTNLIKTIEAYLGGGVYKVEVRSVYGVMADLSLDVSFLKGDPTDSVIIVYGKDAAGWTLDGYYIPRLASGGIHASELFARGMETVRVCRVCITKAGVDLKESADGSTCTECGAAIDFIDEDLFDLDAQLDDWSSEA